MAAVPSKRPKPQRRSTAVADRRPPSDTRAEMELLGGIMLLPSVLTDVTQLVQPEDFFDPAHGTLLRHILSLRATGKPVDPTLLVDSLKAGAEFDAVGGMGYLSKVINCVPHAAHAVYYAELVAAHALRRRLIAECTALLADAYDAQSEPTELLRQAELAVAAVAKRVPNLAKTVRLSDAAQDVIAALENVEQRQTVNRAHFGLVSIDEALGPIMPGELCIVAGRPGSGKTAFAQQMLRHSALQQRPCLMISLEMTDRELASRELCRFTGIDSRAIRSGDVSKTDLQRMRNVQQEMTELPFFLWAPAKATLASIRGVATQAVAKQGVRLIAVDYFQLISGEQNGRDDRREQFVETCHGLKSLAKELSLPIVVLSQLNRQAENAEPTKAMLRETGAIEEDADCILFLHQSDPKKHDERTLIAAKFRHSSVGRLTLKWDGRRTEFSDLGAADHPNYDPSFEQFNQR